MKLQERSDRTAGVLLLVLLMLAVYALKPLFYRHGHERLPCENPVFVQVGGDVRCPGVYAFCHEVPFAELMAKTGSPSRESGPSTQFPGFDLSQGARVSVRCEGEKCTFSQDEMIGFYKLTLGIPLSLNTESEVGLTAVPGIGPSLAKAIVAERSRRGGFKRVEEVMAVKGIGGRVFNKIETYLKL
jgi:competence protein ComEA